MKKIQNPIVTNLLLAIESFRVAAYRALRDLYIHIVLFFILGCFHFSYIVSLMVIYSAVYAVLYNILFFITFTTGKIKRIAITYVLYAILMFCVFQNLTDGDYTDTFFFSIPQRRLGNWWMLSVMCAPICFFLLDKFLKRSFFEKVLGKDKLGKIVTVANKIQNVILTLLMVFVCVVVIIFIILKFWPHLELLLP